ncbi:MAG: hypothetical protein AB7K24_19325, partial [Gemmataceae bacterium]
YLTRQIITFTDVARIRAHPRTQSAYIRGRIVRFPRKQDHAQGAQKSAVCFADCVRGFSSR